MADDVQLARLEKVLSARRESYPNEDVEVSFRMACAELGITDKHERNHYWVRISTTGRLKMIGEWERRGRFSGRDRAAGAEVEERLEQVQLDFDKPKDKGAA